MRIKSSGIIGASERGRDTIDGSISRIDGSIST
jgi:hypothetical protein